jgi:hypothetical protein
MDQGDALIEGQLPVEERGALVGRQMSVGPGVTVRLRSR